MWEYMSHYGWGMEMGMGFGMLLFWGLLVVAIVLLVKYTWDSSAFPEHKQEKSALDILKVRYTRGEIRREEFDQKKRDLKS